MRLTVSARSIFCLFETICNWRRNICHNCNVKVFTMEGCTNQNGEYLVQMSVHVAFLKICFELIDANQIYMLDACGKFEALLINKKWVEFTYRSQEIKIRAHVALWRKIKSFVYDDHFEIFDRKTYEVLVDTKYLRIKSLLFLRYNILAAAVFIQIE